MMRAIECLADAVEKLHDLNRVVSEVSDQRDLEIALSSLRVRSLARPHTGD